MRMLPVAIIALPVAALAFSVQPQRTALIRAMQVAEDSRARDSAGMRPLREGLNGGDTLLQIQALRAIGRLESPLFAGEVRRFLGSPSASVRAEAAFALAQSTAGVASLPPEARASFIDSAIAELNAVVVRESSARSRALMARSVTRVTPATRAHFRAQESAGIAALAASRDSSDILMSLLSLERLIRLHNGLGPVSPATLDSLRRVLITPALFSGYARALAFTALNAAGVVDARLLEERRRDPEPGIRRLIAAAVAGRADLENRHSILNSMSSDPSQIVRVEVMRGWLRSGPAQTCVGLANGATLDTSIAVRLAATDALAQMERCPATERDALVRLLSEAARHPNQSARLTLHQGAHALTVLARVAPDEARPLVQDASAHPSWIRRVYVARAAATLLDTAALYRLSRDTNSNVVAEAITGLGRVARRSADSVYTRALRHSDYNVVRVAAMAMQGQPRTFAIGAVLEAELARITGERRETSRDVRLALLDRIAELAVPSASEALLYRYVSDFDPVIANRAAEITSRWIGRAWAVTPSRVPPADSPPVDSPVLQGTRLRFTMAAGGSFEMELIPTVAPYTVARLLRLTRAGYYNGLTFHRVVPNFVVQGGSPGANEYVGDGPFMRDEIWMHSHERGTVGISTRGRDTGDAQIFINSIDNPRLDFDYTIFARVVSGMSVVDGLLEGDVIQRVEVVTPR
jgi:cyclophilin family peptidyl-prolyl cis-trans isomerase